MNGFKHLFKRCLIAFILFGLATISTAYSAEAVFEAENVEMTALTGSNEECITSVTFNSDGKIVASASYSGILKFWDVKNKSCLRKFLYTKREILSMALNPRDDRYLLMAFSDKKVKLVCVNTGVDVWEISIAANSVAFSPDGYKVALAGDKGLWLRDAGTGKPIMAYSDKRLKASHVMFSPDSKYLAAVCFEKNIFLWRIEHGRRGDKFISSDGDVNSIAISYDGRYLAAASDNGAIYFWENKLKKYRVFEGHSGGVNAVAFSHDNKFLLSASDDGTARLWEVASGDCFQIYSSEESPINALTCVLFSPDDTNIVIGSNMGIIIQPNSKDVLMSRKLTKGIMAKQNKKNRIC